ncbi:Na/Pi cotransporter family protein [Desulfosarcina ovata]|uniref:Na/Pi cotransporter n=2 Tax=Desulfosarcina ovata TaxID=83564 RepID=A0A5K8AJN6_9BACT|nr:Na/Pi cotransporter family protein [Desulfosarcina ovata]BBO85132.1 Na/Pi cotransporter [Desulfosarcina ovata subsp. sediminis]BBO91884.1 Na/Pi cotransporter [Desulfosarcina ovata subsp. ovata]
MTGVLITTLGGLGMFILGMKMMTEGLQMSAGKRIKAILSAVSSNRVLGCLTGTVVTAMVQSSSAATVMLIGFVTAGLMTLQQAVGMILGANIGTTVTAQLIAFKLSALALPAVATGVVLKYFTQQKKTRYIGDVVLGFGLLFYGMTIMKHGLAPIKSDPNFLAFFTKFDPSSMEGLLLCVVVGAGLTIMVQSSSATIGLTMTLASQGLLAFPGAMALVLGENIGTTITAELATIGSNNINAHRAARAHTMFNVIGVTLMLCVFPMFVKLVEAVTLSLGAGPVDQVVGDDLVNVGRYIANGHTLFNVINASFFLLVLPWLIKVAILLSPKEEEEIDYYRLPNFGDRLIDTPIAAIVESRSEILRMAETANYTFRKTVKRLQDRDYKKLAKWRKVENHLDDMQREILAYLIRIYQSDVSESEAKEVSSLMRMTNNIERIGDSVENIAQSIEDMIEGNLTFTERAMIDLESLVEKVLAFMELLTSAMHQRPADFMKQADKLENAIDAMREKFRDEHIQRLRSCECGIDQGLVYVSLLTNLEKIGDYCFNIAEAVAGKK